MVDRVHRRMLILLIVIIDQLDRNLCIRIRIEVISLVLQLFPEFLIILNNSIVDTNYIPVITAVRMCIQLTRFPVCRPAGMPDSACSVHCGSIIRLFRKDAQTSFRLYDLHLIFTVTHCKSCRIISAILQLCETIQQYRCRLSMSSKSNNSTHIFISPSDSINYFVLYTVAGT